MPNLFRSRPDPTAVRRQLERELADARAVEQVHKLAAFSERLLAHRRRFDKRGLFLALHPDDRYPALYIIKRDHSSHAHVWWCHDSLRLEASYRHHNGDHKKIMDVTLSADIELAEACLMKLLEDGDLRLGDAYLPGDLIPLDRVPRSRFDASAAALSAPIIEAEIVATKASAGNTRLVPVPLDIQKRRSWWRR